MVSCHPQPVPTTILIVDDYPGFRRWAGDMLAAEGFSVIGEAADGASAIREVDRLSPDVMLLDVRLPDIDGFEVAERLRDHRHGPAVVLTSSRGREEYRTRLGSTAAVGFVPKHQLSGDALRGILGEPA